MRGKRAYLLSVIGAIFIITLVCSTLTATADETSSGTGDILDYDGTIREWIETEADTPTGTTWRLFEHFGGFWADAEKDPDPGDNLLCWAAAASNMMEWTGWGFVSGMEHDDTDDFFQFFRNHVTDGGHFIDAGIDWWFDGTLNDEGADAAHEDVDHTGFWSTYTASDYMFNSWSKPAVMENIRSQLIAGKPVGLSIYGLNGGAHAITCWGFNYDTAGGTYGPTDNEYYQGIWVTDSDSHKGQWNPPDMLRYFSVEYWDNGTGTLDDDYWYMPNYGGGWYIWGVTSLDVFPGATRPTSDADGPYIVNEGTTVNFDASSSSDDSPLEHRWDFNADGTWDTGWLSAEVTSPMTWYDDYTGEIYLEVFDGRLRDMDITTITVLNVAPIADAGSDRTVYEGDVVSFSGDFTDPGSSDTHTFVWDFDDGTSSDQQNPTHTYCDNGIYTVTLTVTDDDGGTDSDEVIITVLNVAPVADAGDDSNTDEYASISLFGSATDVGDCDTFTYHWDFDDGTSSDQQNPTHVYGDNGIYTVTLTVTDDDGAFDTDTVLITVGNVDPLFVSEIDLLWPYPGNEGYILPIVHELTFTIDAYDQGSDDIIFLWNWGDGSTETHIYYNNGATADPVISPDINPITSSDLATHTYSEAGEYLVTLTITDDDGGTVSDFIIVKVLNMEEAKHHLNDYIQGLNDSCFKGKADVRKNAFDNMFDALDDMLVNQAYQGFIQSLNNNIRSKCDGAIDGKINNDWIIDPDAQYHICAKIDDLTAYIATFL